ncbi:MAG TPA: alpha/beta fold hydrolase [Usitatibacter sp.]|nr:alpha/beta fold hydrolase [Usitatibacter sp.]
MRRQPLYIGEGDQASFGWLHSDEAAPPRDCVAVLCPPTGHEYTRAHRTLRHLADRLARRGVPALRFDYHGIGDSPGTDLDPDRVGHWLSDIKAAVARAKALTGKPRVCLIGLRLGATLAAMATWDTPADLLVLWNPVVKGRGYIRELQAIAMAAERTASEIDGALESAGFVMSAETIEAVRGINLLERDVRAGRVLVVARDDTAADATLNEKLSERGVDNAYYRAPGWAGMMAEHQFTVVPDEALDHIAEWVDCHSNEAQGAGALPAAQAHRSAPSIAFALDGATITESAVHFGPANHLFGVLTTANEATRRPAILMFNAGSVHHVGPNRLHVTLSRHLAAAGFDCLRFDLESLGDSVLRGEGRENYPYPQTAAADARAALEFLRARGYERIIAMGLCSGAHTTFHTGLEFADHPIEEIIMINPMTFYWQEGMSLDTTRKFEDAAAYRRSMKDPSRWMKLLRGDVNVKRLVEVVISQACNKLRLREDPRLSGDLRRLCDHLNRPVTFFIAEGDPGRDILMAGAPRTATRAMKRGAMRVEMIPGADHTFSQFRPRKELMARLGAHLANRRAARPSAAS